MRLSETEFELLALLLSQELSGREIARLYHEETGNPISYGTLYTTCRRLKERGYIKSRDDQDEDGRVRYFRATGTGALAVYEMRKQYLRLVKLAPA